MNLYAYAGNNPITYDDPFGLCPPYDHDPCNMSTGDKNLDNPDTRQIMENNFKTAPPDQHQLGVKDEVWSWAEPAENGAIMTSETVGTPASVVPPPQPADALFGTHGHVNEGQTVCCDKNGKAGTASSGGPGTDDQNVARHSTVPTYTVGKTKIWRTDPGTGKITEFDRWKKTP